MNLKELALLYSEIYIAETDLVSSQVLSDVRPENYVIFKTKPNSKLTVYLKPEEYKDKNLTEFLKKILVNGLKVAPEKVSFAIVKNPFPSILLAKNPNSVAILFGDFLLEQDNIPSETVVCQVFALSEMINDETKKRTAWNKMKEILDKL
jgi:hypothetical protein